jgi:hypothetical protein
MYIILDVGTGTCTVVMHCKIWLTGILVAMYFDVSKRTFLKTLNFGESRTRLGELQGSLG